MVRNNKFRWIHISDLHFKDGDSYDRDVVLTSLLDEISHQQKNGFGANAVFVTGDIANSGSKNEYVEATKFFDKLLNLAKLEKKYLFIVPGNHDVNRKKAVGLIRTIDSEEQAIQYFEPNSPKPHFIKFQEFKEWFDDYFSGIRTFSSNSTCHSLEVIDFSDYKVNVLLINSALFCSDDSDNGNLWIGRRCLSESTDMLSLDSNSGNHINFAIMHHPLDWLHDTERANIKSKLQRKMDFVLRGHLHETDVACIKDALGECLHLAAGASYQTRKWPNRALLCTVNFDTNKLSILPIRYEDKPEKWTLDTSVFPDNEDYIGIFDVYRRINYCHKTSFYADKNHPLEYDENINIERDNKLNLDSNAGNFTNHYVYKRFIYHKIVGNEVLDLSGVKYPYGIDNDPTEFSDIFEINKSVTCVMWLPQAQYLENSPLQRFTVVVALCIKDVDNIFRSMENTIINTSLLNFDRTPSKLRNEEKEELFNSIAIALSESFTTAIGFSDNILQVGRRNAIIAYDAILSNVLLPVLQANKRFEVDKFNLFLPKVGRDNANLLKSAKRLVKAVYDLNGTYNVDFIQDESLMKINQICRLVAWAVGAAHNHENIKWLNKLDI